ncbi:ShlB/FhaC/HecB family hemolysin secretion/activation protein [Gallaecimonas kandeliae]|uniref:ShlB/FhaC/HecB family hemolysin secretion/activation protein n=1 Tax=Gallaecimonas kandeliae TaxID=3029055 RepID=UPI0026496A93|nr:ShlB/FhaC/HecB family hemolysin secretion/activation protein [Gallaecimonas kandeliae]WKE65271.1 ShlB/FhaC/HecB family hemolysin secretion/activation protein [Gallaecimonas kandeliae]
MEAVLPRNWPGSVFLLFLLFFSSSYAADVSLTSAPPRHDQEQWLKKQQDRLRQQQAPYKVAPDIFLQQELNKREATEAQGEANKRCFTIHHLVFEGITRISKKDLGKFKASYESKCLGLDKIQSVIKAVTSLYIEKGLITSRAYVKPQNLASGTLVITVIEGKVDHLLSVDQHLTSTQLAMAFPTGNDEILNLRNLEQGLEQLNRLPMNNATMELVPGDTEGTSTVSIRNALQPWWRGSVGLTNKKTDDFNVMQLDGNLAVDDILGINDSLLFSASTEIGHHDLHAQSNSYSFFGSVPFGYWLFSLNSSYFDYEQAIRGQVVNFLSHGSATVNNLSIANMLYRGQRDKLKASGSITRKQTKNYIEDVFLESSSRVLYIFSLGLDYSRYLDDGGALSLGIKWDKSLSWWGATTKVVAAEDAYQFDKYSVAASFQKPLDTSLGQFDYQLNSMYLYSHDDIIASEGVSIGGRYDVRGFNGNSLFGHQGGYVRNEVGHIFPADNSLVRKVRVYGALDSGIVRAKNNERSGNKALAGASIGLQLMGPRLSLDLIYSKALYKPNSFVAGEHEFYASARFNF